MEQKTHSQYLWMVRHRAFRKTWKAGGVFGKLTSIALSIAVSVWLNPPTSVTDLLRVNTVIIGVIVAVLYIVLYLWFFGREPVIIHNEQEKEISRLKDTWEGEQIDLTLPISAFNDPHRKWIGGILITNSAGNTISHVVVRLKEGSCYCIRPSGERIPRLNAVWGDKTKLCDGVSIFSKQDRAVNIAQVNEVLEFEWLFPGEPRIDKPDLEDVQGDVNTKRAVYELVLQIDATIDERPLIAQEVKMMITFTWAFRAGTSPKLEILGERIEDGKEPTET